MKNYVTRINLKTACENRKQLINFCLNSTKQYLAIGWSYVHKNRTDKLRSYREYYEAIRSTVKRMNPVLNIFLDADTDDLFWTRDLDGNYWICRSLGTAQAYFDDKNDIGAVLRIEAYNVGLEVPGQIKSSFNRANAGTAEKIKSEIITEFSKYIFNAKSGKKAYDFKKISGSFLDNLPDFELEELVISYLQIKENYYILSNSIANKSTTIKIECELILRDKLNPQKAVVQVKGGNSKEIDVFDYQAFLDKGYIVYLYAHKIKNLDKFENAIEITKTQLQDFYNEYKSLLPDSIVKWENLF